MIRNKDPVVKLLALEIEPRFTGLLLLTRVPLITRLADALLVDCLRFVARADDFLRAVRLGAESAHVEHGSFSRLGEATDSVVFFGSPPVALFLTRLCELVFLEELTAFVDEPFALRRLPPDSET